MHLLKVLSKRHPVKRRKMRGGSKKCTFSRYCKMVNRFETYFVDYYAYFTVELHQF